MKTRNLIATLALSIAFAVLGAGSAAADIYESDKFGIETFETTFIEPFGGSPTTAGGHPDLRVVLNLNQRIGVDSGGQPAETTAGQVRDIEVGMPAGLVGNPRAVPTCSMEDIVATEGFCSPAAQVGVFEYQGFEWPIYNLETPEEQTAVLAVFIFGVPGKIVISPRTDGDYGLTAQLSKINQALPLAKSVLTIWGNPADPVHNPQRFFGFFQPNAPANIPVKPFLSLPTRCEELTTTVRADSWQNPGDWKQAASTTPALEGCDKLPFAPTLDARPTVRSADSPSGLEATLRLPQNTTEPDKPSTAALKTATVTLPEGLVVNPSTANGLAACGPAQIGLMTPVRAGAPRFDRRPAACPAASKVGTAEIITPVFEKPLPGAVYVMTPDENPFGSLLGLYVVVEGRGLVIKLAGKVEANPSTGQLKATFDENPQLPFEEFKLDLEGGPLGILRTPATCGSFATDSTLTAWSAPATPTVQSSNRWSIAQGPKGCASSEAQLPSRPSFEAGSTSTLAGVYSPFVLSLAREDGTRELTGIDATLPKGLLAKLAGIPYCSDAALVAAAAKPGHAEQAAASCPGAAEVGSVTVGSGAGSSPFYVPGKAYLAGPYKGAPLSLAVVVPAVAGPFDLGTVVVRNALYVDPESAQVHAVSDPFPRILQGIPLDLRSVDLRLDRPQFTKNPTNCNPFAISGAAVLLGGQSSPLSSRFQVGGCGRLKFKPNLRLSLKGKMNRTGNPALRAVLKMQNSDQANVATTTVVLPKAIFIDNSHINNPCTRVQFNAEACPTGSVLGTATAYTPLLDKPLSGPVYFRSNGGERELPDLVADLNGQIHVTLVGFIDSAKSGGVRTRFANVPDAPVSKFVLKLAGGKKGLLENSKDLCSFTPKAKVHMTGQNGRAASSNLKLGTSCGKTKKRK
ncbi:MAG TPA: hypothetical protein VFJ61_05315 [Solirubrobacterales bacterium]|nr:hypothetical protein [Solirubrobacterales bacterium]